MTDTPYLIAHRVRGEAAFDIAIRQECAICLGAGAVDVTQPPACDECSGEGFWWICSTSGHRAYPYWSEDIHAIMYAAGYIVDKQMPPNWPDHYAVNKSTEAKPGSLLERLGLLRKQQPTAPLRRV